MNNKIVLERVNEKTFKVVQDVTVFGVHIPAGFNTDGASVPALLRPVISHFGKGFEAALVHDYVLMGKVTAKERKPGDKQFYRNLRLCGFSRLRAYTCYLGVRLGSMIPLFRPKYK